MKTKTIRIEGVSATAARAESKGCWKGSWRSRGDVFYEAGEARVKFSEHTVGHISTMARDKR